MARLALALALMLVVAASAVAAPRAVVIDGDTLELEGRVVALRGIDAPELGQICIHDGTVWHCGRDAAFALKKVLDLDAASLVCHDVDAAGADPGLPVVACMAGGEDVSIRMLHDGYALALADAPPAYHEAERAARDASLGVWRGRFVAPAAWREGARLVGAPVVRCPVKGVVDGAGRHYYYVPTDATYDDVSVNPARGGRWFCSDVEARAAGWRRPGEG